ncbi:hypothetical protein [Polaribacter batillariae]|nr:hypothetical protein [Polaribacter batillariae]
MRKEQFTASVAGRYDNQPNFVEKKQSWMDSLVQWFHDFLEKAE